MENFDYNANQSFNHGRYNPVFRTNPDYGFINDIIDNFIHPQEGHDVRPAPVSIVSYTGTTQDRLDGDLGTASCGLCASNFARQVFEQYTSGMRNRDLFRWLLSRECALKITEIAGLYRRDNHLDVHKIIGRPTVRYFSNGQFSHIKGRVPGVPYFTEVLDAKTPIDWLPCTYESFREILWRLDSISGISAAIITTPTEIVAAMQIPMEGAINDKIFVVFDSHGADDFYPSGSGMIICPTVEAGATVLTHKFRNNSSLEIETSLVEPRTDLTVTSRNEILLEASIELLELQNRVDESKAEERDRESRHEEMERKIKEYEDNNRTLTSEVMNKSQEIERLRQQLRSASRQVTLKQRAVEEARREVFRAEEYAATMQDTFEEKDRIISGLQRQLDTEMHLHANRREARRAAEEEVFTLRDNLMETNETIMNMEREFSVLTDDPYASGAQDNWAARPAKRTYERNNHRTASAYRQYPDKHTKQRTATSNRFFQRNVREPEWIPSDRAQHGSATSSYRHPERTLGCFRHFKAMLGLL